MAKYNLTKRKPKEVVYRNKMRPELLDTLYEKILDVFVVQKKYNDPNFSAKQLAEKLHTNTRYISAAINTRFGVNYSTVVNEFRIKEAIALLEDKNLNNKTIEEIGAMVGFANRQSFYAAFYKNKGITPRTYRLRNKREK